MSSDQHARRFGMRARRILSTGTAAVIEGLEGRRLLSVAYDNTLLAQTGTGGITAITPDVSINDNGAVAFQGSAATPNGLFAGDGTTAFPVKEAQGSTNFKQFSQINNNNLIVGDMQIPGPVSFIQTVDGKTGQQLTIAKASAGTGNFAAVLFPVINNKGTVVFSALKNNVSDNTQYLENSAGQELAISTSLIQLRMDEADNGVVVFRQGNLPTSPIVETAVTFTALRAVAGSSSFSALGQSPGISEDGGSVAFYGVNSSGPGIFVSTGGKIIEVASIEKDPSGKVIGPISAFSADTRVDISLTPSAGTPGYVVFQATGTDGKQGIYTVELDADASTGIAVQSPVLVAEVGQTVPGLSNPVQSLSLYDPLNVHGSVAYSVTTSSGSAVVRADPVRRPVLVLPGIAGDFVADTQKYLLWVEDRGIDPTLLKIDPLVKTYDDTIQTFENQGYVMGKDLFAAVYDWRLDPGPTPFSGATGHVPGLTGDNITAGKYTYGVDYLGYWLKQAEDSWESRFHEPLDSVDVICHSTGGLVARTYMESDAYGADYTDPTYGKNCPAQSQRHRDGRRAQSRRGRAVQSSQR